MRVRVDLLDALVEETLELMLDQGRLAAAIERGRAEEARRRSSRCQLHVRKLYAELMEMRLVPFETVAHRILGLTAGRYFIQVIGYKGAISGGVTPCYRSQIQEVNLTADSDIGTSTAPFDDSAEPTGCNSTKPTPGASR